MALGDKIAVPRFDAGFLLLVFVLTTVAQLGHRLRLTAPNRLLQLCCLELLARSQALVNDNFLHDDHSGQTNQAESLLLT